MRLWHQFLIPYLPTYQLLGQHREVCALRGLGFKRPHAIVNYVFEYPYYYLYKFHLLVMKEMLKRHFSVEKLWYDCQYRGKKLGYDRTKFTKKVHVPPLIYQEHNFSYLKLCLLNLVSKNIYLDIPKNSLLYKILEKNSLLNLVRVID